MLKYQLHKQLSQIIGDPVDTSVSTIPDGTRYTAEVRDLYLNRAAVKIMRDVIEPFFNYPVKQSSAVAERFFSKSIHTQYINPADNVGTTYASSPAFAAYKLNPYSQSLGIANEPAFFIRASLYNNSTNRAKPLPIRYGNDVSSFINDDYTYRKEPFLKVDRLYIDELASPAGLSNSEYVVEIYRPILNYNTNERADYSNYLLNITYVIYPDDITFVSPDKKWVLEPWMYDLAIKQAAVYALLDSQDADMPERILMAEQMIKMPRGRQ